MNGRAVWAGPNIGKLHHQILLAPFLLFNVALRFDKAILKIFFGFGKPEACVEAVIQRRPGGKVICLRYNQGRF